MSHGSVWSSLRLRFAQVGFAHGVMNTDNLSLLGVTVDLLLGWRLDRLELNLPCACMRMSLGQQLDHA